MNNQYKIRTITCISCGTIVTKRMPKGRRYCSLDCYRSSKRPQRQTGDTQPCTWCGQPVYVTKSRLGHERYFCSTEHHNMWQGRNKTEHVCKVCGTHFLASPSRSKDNTLKYCSLQCRDADPEHKAHLLEMNAFQQKSGSSSIERIGYSILDSLGIEYHPQHLVAGKFCVDAFIPIDDIVIQFDGDYWHGNPERYSKLDHRQQKRVHLDKSQDAYMRKCGYGIIRIWETDLKKRPEEVKARLRRLLVLDEHTPALQE